MVTPLENIIDVSNRAYGWYTIRDFNGYEWCPTLEMLRSLKSSKAHPYGVLVKEKNNKYEITNNNNQRVKISKNDLIMRVNFSFGHYTWEVNNTHPRNFRMGILPQAEVDKDTTLISKPRPIKKGNQDKNLIIPKFTIKSDED